MNKRMINLGRMATLALVLLSLPLAANAASELVLSGGGAASQTIVCATSVCSFNGSQGAFNITIDIGQSNNFPPQLNLTSVNSAIAVPQDLTIAYSINNLTATAASFVQTFTANILGNGSVPATSTSFTTFYNANNVLGAMVTALATQNLSTTTSLAASAANVNGNFNFGPAMYSLTQVLTLHDTASGGNQLLTGALIIPEPASLSLVGLGFLGLGAGLRKKLLKA